MIRRTNSLRFDSSINELDKTANPFVVWVDLKLDQQSAKTPNGDISTLINSIQVIRSPDAAGLSDVIQALSPALLCFDFDNPDTAGLGLLRDTMHKHPSLPVLMLTEFHSEELATWAFRSGVRDFVVKPVAPDKLIEKIRILGELAILARGSLSRCCLFPSQPIPARDPTMLPRLNRRSRTIEAAIPYIAANFDKKINLNTIAGLCHLSSSQFSRTFKKERGITYCEYLVRYRIAKACELLANSRSIKEVAFAVGFNDLSYFARSFRRVMTVPPTAYIRRRDMGSRRLSRGARDRRASTGERRRIAP